MDDETTTPLRVFAWNPNGIRALLKNNNTVGGKAAGHLDAFLREQRPDVIFFPETKGNRAAQFETQCKLEAVFKRALPGKRWKWCWSYCDRLGRHGNAVAVSKEFAIREVEYRLTADEPHETEGRVISLILRDHPIVLIGLYVPNASTKLSRLDHKVDWLRKLRVLMDDYRAQDLQVIVIGDINVAPDERDLCNPSSNLKTPGYSPKERKAYQWMMAAASSGEQQQSEDDLRRFDGYVEVYREKNPLLPVRSQGHEGVYTFWNTRSKARDRNAGWRIDHVLTTREMLDRVTQCLICPQYHGSDHCPVGVEVILSFTQSV